MPFLELESASVTVCTTEVWLINTKEYWSFFDHLSVCGNRGASEASLALCLNLDSIGTLSCNLRH